MKLPKINIKHRSQQDIIFSCVYMKSKCHLIVWTQHADRRLLSQLGTNIAASRETNFTTTTTTTANEDLRAILENMNENIERFRHKSNGRNKHKTLATFPFSYCVLHIRKYDTLISSHIHIRNSNRVIDTDVSWKM